MGCGPAWAMLCGQGLHPGHWPVLRGQWQPTAVVPTHPLTSEHAAALGNKTCEHRRKDRARWAWRSCKSGSDQSCWEWDQPLSGHPPAPRCPGGMTAISGRRSGRRSCVGTIVALPRQTNLTLIPAERFDNNAVCRQGNPECGVPPGETLCWTWASAANTCERLDSTVYSHGPSSRHSIGRDTGTSSHLLLAAPRRCHLTRPYHLWERMELGKNYSETSFCSSRGSETRDLPQKHDSS